MRGCGKLLPQHACWPCPIKCLVAQVRDHLSGQLTHQIQAYNSSNSPLTIDRLQQEVGLPPPSPAASHSPPPPPPSSITAAARTTTQTGMKVALSHPLLAATKSMQTAQVHRTNSTHRCVCIHPCMHMDTLTHTHAHTHTHTHTTHTRCMLIHHMTHIGLLEPPCEKTEGCRGCHPSGNGSGGAAAGSCCSGQQLRSFSHTQV